VPGNWNSGIIRDPKPPTATKLTKLPLVSWLENWTTGRESGYCTLHPSLPIAKLIS